MGHTCNQNSLLTLQPVPAAHHLKRSDQPFLARNAEMSSRVVGHLMYPGVLLLQEGTPRFDAIFSHLYTLMFFYIIHSALSCKKDNPFAPLKILLVVQKE